MKQYIVFLVVIFTLIPMIHYAQDADPPPLLIPDDTELKERKELLIPNVFSPNGDGQNDYFKINNITDEQLVDFKVFNRLGKILFRTDDPLRGWDGNHKEVQQEVGVYGYMIRIAYPDGYIETYKGTVMLLR